MLGVYCILIHMLMCMLTFDRRVVEGSGVGSAGCVLHFDTYVDVHVDI